MAMRFRFPAINAYLCGGTVNDGQIFDNSARPLPSQALVQNHTVVVVDCTSVQFCLQSDHSHGIRLQPL